MMFQIHKSALNCICMHLLCGIKTKVYFRSINTRKFNLWWYLTFLSLNGEPGLEAVRIIIVHQGNNNCNVGFDELSASR